MSELVEIVNEKVESAKQKSFNTKPVFFRLTNEKDRDIFECLLKENPSLIIYDTFCEQLEELNKINALKKQSPNLKEKKNYFKNNSIIDEGVWVYYPWLNKVVHILDEEDFITVRTNRNQHKITKSEQELLRKKKIGVIGLSVGQSIAITLVLERGCGEIKIADFDTIELSNLNRIKTGIYNLGLKKSVQTAREIVELDPYIKVVCYEEGITENNLDDFLTKDGKLDLLIEECDSLDIKIVSRIKAKKYGIPVLMETNERGMIDIERYDLDSSYPMLHNLIGEVSWKELSNLTNEQKLPMMMKLAAFKNITSRQKITVLEMGYSISTWPQLASNVIMGAGVTTDVARRILLNQLQTSGRFYVDVENIITDNKKLASSYFPPVIKELSVTDMHDMAVRIIANAVSDRMAISKEVIEKIVAEAATAPSSGNDQPWKFFFLSNRLFLFHEIARSYSFGDYKNMASYISLGGLIENVVLSSHKKRLEISVTLFPEENNTSCIAFFDFKKVADITTEKHDLDDLYDYIFERCTNRKITHNEKAPPEILEQLKLAAESIECVKASFVTDDNKLKTLGNIISAGDRIRIMHPQGHYEFFNREIWADIEGKEIKRTGMNIASLELSPQAAFALDLIKQEEIITILREINGLQALKTLSVPNVMNSSAMGFIEVGSFTHMQFVNGGRSMQRQWLTATKLGYAYHPMVIPLYLFYRLIFGNGEGLNETTVVELKELRKQFMDIFPGEKERGEVLLFRIFKSSNSEMRSPRLPLDEILYTN